MAGRSAVISVIVTGEASGATKAFEQGEKAAKGFKDQVEKVDKGFDGVRDSADNTERRIVGFRDSLTGTGDVMKGLRDGDMITLATGFADLSSSVANLGADMLDWGKKAVTAGKNVVAAHAGSVAAKAKDVAAAVAHKAASLASAAATQAQTAAQWLLNAAMSANPILLVVVALAALVAGFVIAWKNSETFREIVTGAFDKVSAIAQAVFGWIKDNWPLLLAILTGPIGLAVLAIVKNWDEIKAGFTAVKDWIGARVNDIVSFITGVPGRIAGFASSGFNAVRDAATGAKDWVSTKVEEIVTSVASLPGKLTGKFTGMFDGVKDAWRAAWNWIIYKWNGLEFKMPEVDTHIPGVGKVGGWKLGTPDLQPLARGTRNFAGGLALVGEEGPELLQLPAGSAVTPHRQTAQMLAAGGGVTLINNGIITTADVDRWLEDRLAKLRKRGSSALGGTGG